MHTDRDLESALSVGEYLSQGTDMVNKIALLIDTNPGGGPKYRDLDSLLGLACNDFTNALKYIKEMNGNAIRHVSERLRAKVMGAIKMYESAAEKYPPLMSDLKGDLKDPYTKMEELVKFVDRETDINKRRVDLLMDLLQLAPPGREINWRRDIRVAAIKKTKEAVELGMHKEDVTYTGQMPIQDAKSYVKGLCRIFNIDMEPKDTE